LRDESSKTWRAEYQARGGELNLCSKELEIVISSKRRIVLLKRVISVFNTCEEVES
jgi:hypothetical protein